MRCVECGKAELKLEKRNISYEYKGQHTTLHDIEGEFCPECGEAVFSPDQSDIFNEQALAFNKKINALKVKPNYFKQVREKLKLDQKQAAELFGGGVNAFSRYETGRSTPPLSLIQLFKLLDKRPELIRELIDTEAAPAHISKNASIEYTHKIDVFENTSDRHEFKKYFLSISSVSHLAATTGFAAWQVINDTAAPEPAKIDIEARKSKPKKTKIWSANLESFELNDLEDYLHNNDRSTQHAVRSH